MSLNLYNLELTIARLSQSTATTIELLSYAKAIQNAKTGSVTTVAAFANLPVPSTVADGSLYFVESDRIFYIPSREYGIWRKLTEDVISNVWTWGCNSYGRLGDNTIISKRSPVGVVGGFTNWCQVSATGFHTTALRTNGSLWAWGRNLEGQLGDNSTISRSSPVSVVGGFTDWCQVSAGGVHNTALRTNGTMWTWGSNSNGQLGDNSTISRSSPVSVVGGFTDWCQVSAGGVHNTALRTNGTMWTWGGNTQGQLGNNSTLGTSSPVAVVSGFTNWCQVAAGVFHTAAIRTDGRLWMWGRNSYGQLGDDTVVNKSSPVSVVGGFTDWCQVSLSPQLGHTVGLRSNGTLWAWGRNAQGQLGDNTTLNKSSPESIVGGFTDWCQVSAGNQHTAALRTNSTVWAWGGNIKGQLGDNTVISKRSPVSVVFSGTASWCQVSAGGYHTAAINSNIY